MKKTTVLALLLALATTAICVYNSDWYFNKKIQKTALQNVKLDDVTYNYYPSYSNGTLKAKFEFNNVNEDFVNFAIVVINDEYIFEKHLLDADKFMIAKLVVNAGDLIKSEKGKFEAQTQVKITKKELNKVKFAKDVYREGFVN